MAENSVVESRTPKRVSFECLRCGHLVHRKTTENVPRACPACDGIHFKIKGNENAQ